MRDAKLTQGKKRFFEDLEDFHREVMSTNSKVNRQGCAGGLELVGGRSGRGEGLVRRDQTGLVV